MSIVKLTDAKYCQLCGRDDFSEAKSIAQELTAELHSRGLNFLIMNAKPIGYECKNCGFYSETVTEWQSERHAGLVSEKCGKDPIVDYGQYE